MCGGAEEDTSVVRRRSAVRRRARGGAVAGARWRALVGAHWRGGAGDRAVGRWRAPVVASGGGLQRPRSGAGGHEVAALVAAL